MRQVSEHAAMLSFVLRGKIHVNAYVQMTFF